MPIAAIAAFWAVSILLVLVPGADWAYVIASGLRDHSVLPAVAGLLAGYILLTAAVASGVAALVAKTPAVLTALTTAGAIYLLCLGVTTLLHPSIPQPATTPTTQAQAQPIPTAQAASAPVPGPASMPDPAPVPSPTSMPGPAPVPSPTPSPSPSPTRALTLTATPILTPASTLTPTTAPWPRRAARGAGISGLNPKALLLFVALLPQFAARTAPWPFAAQIALLGLIHTANCGIVYTGVGATARRVLRTRPAVAKAVSRSSGIAMLLIGTLLLAEHLIA